MKRTFYIPLLFFTLSLTSCTTNKILRETNQNLEELNASIDEKFNSLSQPISEISNNFAQMSDSFSKITDEGGIIAQLSYAFSQISPQDIKNSIDTVHEAMQSFIDLSKGINEVGGMEGVMVQLTFGMTLGVSILEKFKAMTTGMPGVAPVEGDIEQYLLTMQQLLNVTKNNVNPSIQSLRQNIQKLLDMQAEARGMESLQTQIEQAQVLESELEQASASLSKGLSFVENYQSDEFAQISDLDQQQISELQTQVNELSTLYKNHANQISSIQSLWQNWPKDQDIAAIQ